MLTGDIVVLIGDVGRPTGAPRWAGRPTTSALIYTTRSGNMFRCRCPTPRWSTSRYGAGFLCGKQLSSDTVSSLIRSVAQELRPPANVEDEAITEATADHMDAPDYFTYDAILNTPRADNLDQNMDKVLRSRSA